MTVDYVDQLSLLVTCLSLLIQKSSLISSEILVEILVSTVSLWLVVSESQLIISNIEV